MGHPNVYVLDGGVSAWREAGLPLASGPDVEAAEGLDEARRRVGSVAPQALVLQVEAGGANVIFVGTSEEFARGHVPGSHWVPRGWLEPRIADHASKGSAVIVTSPDGVDAALAAATLHALGYEASALEGGLSAWTAAGLPVERGLTGVTSIPNDVLPAQRSYAEMHNYLRWEEELGHKYE
jgi:rhodanese-related sulfurtransferase